MHSVLVRYRMKLCLDISLILLEYAATHQSYDNFPLFPLVDHYTYSVIVLEYYLTLELALSV